MYLADLHTHSRCSIDGKHTMAELAEAAVKAGLHELCFTDHVDQVAWRGYEPPERFESGTLPTPAIAALSEGIKFLNEQDPCELRRHEEMLYFRLAGALSSDRIRARVYMPSDRGSVLLFNIPNRPADEIARLLSKRGICLRSGYHCSALGHKTLGTSDTGALRASFSIFNTKDDVDALYKALLEII